MSRYRHRRAVVVAWFGVLAWSWQVPAGAQEAPRDPTVVLDRTGTAAGERMAVRGGGWSTGAELIVELCGRGGIGGSADCDVANQRTAGVGSAGTFSAELTVGVVPRPCPCVVKVTDLRSRVAATAPIAVAGVPTLPIIDDGRPLEPVLEIRDVAVRGGATWIEVLGGAGRRDLTLTLANTGSLAAEAPDLSIAWGGGSDPDGFVEPPEVARIEPGETRELRVPLRREPLTWGKHTAVVEIQGVAVPVSARASTSWYPWGAAVAAVLVFQALALMARNTVRRRLTAARARHGEMGQEPRELPAPPAAPAEIPEADTVVDVTVFEPAVVAARDVVEQTPAEVECPAAQGPVPAPAEGKAAEDSVRLRELERDTAVALAEAASEMEAALAEGREALARLDAAADDTVQLAERFRVEAEGILELTERQAMDAASALGRLVVELIGEMSDRRSAAVAAITRIEDDSRAVLRRHDERLSAAFLAVEAFVDAPTEVDEPAQDRAAEELHPS